MNYAYRTIWNTARAARRLGAALGVLSCGTALALPAGEQVAAGSVTVARPDANSLVVNQASNQAVVNWQSFSIGANESVRFVQPTAFSVILNRILGNNASQIFGSLQSNGIVFLTNPNGVLFARGAQVDVGGLVATTLGISDRNFLGRNYMFSNDGKAGGVVNEGVVNALGGSGGYVALIAPQVSNSGSISASGGSVGLAAGDRVVLDFEHDGKITFKVDLPAAAARIDNTGIVAADGGRVIMSASARDALMSTVLNSSGIVRARGLAKKNGEIVLDGGASGVVRVAGTLDASGKEAGQSGGTVKVLGDKVGLFEQAKIDVSGETGGGTALIGGNFQGKGEEANASATYVAKEASIVADAVTQGDGGKVVVWADATTRFEGAISARGGAQGGDGGSVEVSGKGQLVFAGSVDTTAAAGETGTLLLDPTNLRICDNAVPGSCVDTNVDAATPFQPNTGTGSQLSWQTIDAALATTAVEVKTTAGVDTGEAGDITIAAAHDFNRANDLSFTAAHDIKFSAGADVVNAGSGKLAFVAGGDVQIADARIATGGKVAVEAAGDLTSGGGLISAGSTASDALVVSARNIGTATTPVAIAAAGGVTLASYGEINTGTPLSAAKGLVVAAVAQASQEALKPPLTDATASIHVADIAPPPVVVAKAEESKPVPVVAIKVEEPQPVAVATVKAEEPKPVEVAVIKAEEPPPVVVAKAEEPKLAPSVLKVEEPSLVIIAKVEAPQPAPVAVADDRQGEPERWLELRTALLPKEVMRLCESYLRSYPDGANAQIARAMLDGARTAATGLRLASLTADTIRESVGDADFRADLVKAMRGDGDAAYRIALMHRDGSAGVPANARRVENWLKFAAELGNAIASWQLAEYYGTANMIGEAARYERRAVELGYRPPPRLSNRGYL